MIRLPIFLSFMNLILRYGVAQNCANTQTPISINSFKESYDTVCPSFTVAVTLRITIVRTTIGCYSNGQFLTDTRNSVNPPTPYICSIESLPECTGSCVENQGRAKVNCVNSLGAQFRCEFPYTTRNCDVLEWSRWSEIRTCASGNVATSLRTRTCQHVCTGTTIDNAYCPGVASESAMCVTTTTEKTTSRTTQFTNQNVQTTPAYRGTSMEAPKIFSSTARPILEINTTLSGAYSISNTSAPTTGENFLANNTSTKTAMPTTSSTFYQISPSTQAAASSTAESAALVNTANPGQQTQSTARRSTTAEASGSESRSVTTFSNYENIASRRAQYFTTNQAPTITANQVTTTTTKKRPTTTYSRRLTSKIAETTTSRGEESTTNYTSTMTSTFTPEPLNLSAILIPVFVLLAVFAIILVLVTCKRHHWFRSDRSASYDLTIDSKEVRTAPSKRRSTRRNKRSQNHFINKTYRMSEMDSSNPELTDF